MERVRLALAARAVTRRGRAEHFSEEGSREASGFVFSTFPHFFAPRRFRIFVQSFVMHFLACFFLPNGTVHSSKLLFGAVRLSAWETRAKRGASLEWTRRCDRRQIKADFGIIAGCSSGFMRTFLYNSLYIQAGGAFSSFVPLLSGLLHNNFLCLF